MYHLDNFKKTVNRSSQEVRTLCIWKSHQRPIFSYEMLGSHDEDCEKCCLLKGDAKWTGISLPVFLNNILHPSYGSNCKHSKQGMSWEQTADCLFRFLFNHEDGSSTFPWNISELLTDYKESYSSRFFVFTAMRTTDLTSVRKFSLTFYTAITVLFLLIQTKIKSVFYIVL
jgi:hypothetical protein